MSRFVQGADRRQQTLLPECLDDYVAEDNPVRVVDVFVDELDLKGLGFEGMTPAATGRPAYHPAMLLKLYVYGYLNKVQSSRRLEREAQRNVELMWLTGRLAPDHKTIADFRRENGSAIQAACAQFVVLCRQLGLFGAAVVAIDGSKFKAVNTRDKQLHRLQGEAADRTGRRAHRQLSAGPRHGRSARGRMACRGAVRETGREDRSAPRPDGDVEGRWRQRSKRHLTARCP